MRQTAFTAALAVATCLPAPVVVRPAPNGAPIYTLTAPPIPQTQPTPTTLVPIDGELVPWTLDLHDFRRLAECESGGDWHIRSYPYRGGLQFLPSSWRAVGGTGDPADAPIVEQLERARMLLDIQGPAAWPVCSRRIGWS